jgi:hypothetical protein
VHDGPPEKRPRSLRPEFQLSTVTRVKKVA